jgi:DNA-binding transcriptional LysR family regulator
MLHSRMLRYLDEIVRSGSFRKAAATLNIASSAINRQVLALERDLGAPIFERMPRRLRLTAMGELVLLHVRQTLKDHERLAARIEELRGLQSGEVKIATIGTLASNPLVAVIEELHNRHPHLTLNVEVRRGVDAAVLNGEVELALAYDIPLSPRLRVLGEYKKGLGAAMSPGHPLAARPHIRLSDCMAFPLAVPDASVSIRPILERALPPKANLSPALVSNSVQMLKRMAMISPHITFLNNWDVASEVADGKLCLVPIPELATIQQTLILVCRRESALDPAAYLVAQELVRVLDATA